MSMQSFLISALARQFARADVNSLAEVHPHDWLVWEPGQWKPASQSTLVGGPGKMPEKKPGQEALALALIENASKQLTLGREKADLVINDGTISSLHLLFMKTAAGWTVRDAGSSNGTMINGQKLETGKPRPLTPGCTIQAGSVVLSYYRPQDFLQRLRF